MSSGVSGLGHLDLVSPWPKRSRLLHSVPHLWNDPLGVIVQDRGTGRQHRDMGEPLTTPGTGDPLQQTVDSLRRRQIDGRHETSVASPTDNRSDGEAG